MRRTAIKRKPPRKPTEAERVARAIFTEPTPGLCECGECDRYSMWRENHHVISKEAIKREERYDLLWDTRNRMRLAKFCHDRHTNAQHRLAVPHVPESVYDFGAELFGSREATSVWLERYYRREAGDLQGWVP